MKVGDMFSSDGGGSLTASTLVSTVGKPKGRPKEPLSAGGSFCLSEAS